MLVYICIASVIGIILGLYVDYYLCIGLYFFAIILVFFKSQNNRIFILIIISLSFLVYSKYTVNKFDTKYKDGLYEDEFKIISLKENTNYYDKYIAKNSKNNKFIIYLPKGKELNKGLKIYAKGEINMPDLARNRGGFNSRRILNSQNIYASFFVDNYYITSLGRFNLIYYIQKEILETFDKLLPGDEKGLVEGMLIGETIDISKDRMTSFKNSGITHLVAVSGTNVVYVMLLVSFIFQKPLRQTIIKLYINNCDYNIYVCIWSFSFCGTSYNNDDTHNHI